MPFCALALDDAYLCVADQATGFQYDEGTMTWKPATYDVEASKYLIKRRRPDNNAKGAFGVSLMGADNPHYFCEVNEERKWLECHDTWYTYLRFHYESLKFISYFEGSYALVPTGSRGNSSYIEIGRCSPVQ